VSKKPIEPEIVVEAEPIRPKVERVPPPPSAAKPLGGLLGALQGLQSLGGVVNSESLKNLAATVRAGKEVLDELVGDEEDDDDDDDEYDDEEEEEEEEDEDDEDDPPRRRSRR